MLELDDVGEDRGPWPTHAVARVEGEAAATLVSAGSSAALVDVQPDPEDHGVAARFGQHAGHLAAVDHDVVWPLDLSGEPERVLRGLRNGDSRDGDSSAAERPPGGLSTTEQRIAVPGGGLPLASVAAAPLRLHVAYRHGPFWQIVLEQLLRRLATLLVEVRPSEAAGEERLDSLGASESAVLTATRLIPPCNRSMFSPACTSGMAWAAGSTSG